MLAGFFRWFAQGFAVEREAVRSVHEALFRRRIAYSASFPQKVNLIDKALYVAYLTSAANQTMALICIGDGIIAGVDISTMQYDGSYAVNPDGSLEGTVEYVIPAGTTLITGAGPSTPTKVPLRLHLPLNFADGHIITLETPFGKVNARFEKLKDLP